MQATGDYVTARNYNVIDPQLQNDKYLSGVRVKVQHHGGGRAGDVLACDERDLIGRVHTGDAQLPRSGRLLEEVFEHVLCACDTGLASGMGKFGRSFYLSSSAVGSQRPHCKKQVAAAFKGQARAAPPKSQCNM